MIYVFINFFCGINNFFKYIILKLIIYETAKWYCVNVNLLSFLIQLAYREDLTFAITLKICLDKQRSRMSELWFFNLVGVNMVSGRILLFNKEIGRLLFLFQLLEKILLAVFFFFPFVDFCMIFKVPPPLPPPLSERSFKDQFMLFWNERRAVGCPSFLWFMAYISIQVRFQLYMLC